MNRGAMVVHVVEHLGLATGLGEVAMNVHSMRSACNKFLSAERFKPPPTKEELKAMAKAEEEKAKQMGTLKPSKTTPTGHQKPDDDDEDEEVADDEWTWVKLHEARDKLMRQKEKLELALHETENVLTETREELHDTQDKLTQANANIEQLEDQAEKNQKKMEKQEKKLAAWPVKAKAAQKSLAARHGAFFAPPQPEDAMVLDMVPRAFTELRVNWIEEKWSRKYAALDELYTALQARWQELQSSLGAREDLIESLTEEVRMLRLRSELADANADKYRRKQVSNRNTFAKRFIAEVAASSITLVFASWRSAAKLLKLQRAAGIESSSEAEEEALSPEEKQKRKEQKQPVDLSAKLAEAVERIAALEAEIAELQRQLQASNGREEDLRRANGALEEQVRKLQQRIAELEKLLQTEKADRKEEVDALKHQIDKLKIQIAELLAGDPYVVWMEGRIKQLTHENDVLVEHRDMYLKNQRRVAPEFAGELCMRCATQVLWRDWVDGPVDAAEQKGQKRPYSAAEQKRLGETSASITYNLHETLPGSRSAARLHLKTPPTPSTRTSTPHSERGSPRRQKTARSLKLPGLPEIRPAWS